MNKITLPISIVIASLIFAVSFFTIELKKVKLDEKQKKAEIENLMISEVYKNKQEISENEDREEDKLLKLKIQFRQECITREEENREKQDELLEQCKTRECYLDILRGIENYEQESGSKLTGESFIEDCVNNLLDKYNY